MRRDRRQAADRQGVQTLKTFLSVVLGKKYMNPSSDIINVLAGLDHVDTVFSDFVGALDGIIRNGRSCKLGYTRREGDLANCVAVELREKAVEVALAVTSGAYQTSLLTYFIQRDLFPAVMKVRALSTHSHGKLTNTPSSSKTLTAQPEYSNPSPSSAF